MTFSLRVFGYDEQIYRFILDDSQRNGKRLAMRRRVLHILVFRCAGPSSSISFHCEDEDHD